MGKNKFGDLACEMHECTAQMASLMIEVQSDEIIAKMRVIDDIKDELEKRDEIYWRQRSRQDFLKSGEKNISFFRKKAKQRVHWNHIESIKDEAGQIFEEEEEIQEVIAGHFENLF